MASAVHEDDKKSILPDWEKCSFRNKESYSEYRFVKPDGTIALGSWVYPEYDNSNQLLGYIER
jgi:hypothetical protein